MAGNKMGALKRKLGINADTPLEPGMLLSAKNEAERKKLEETLNVESVKSVAIKGLI